MTEIFFFFLEQSTSIFSWRYHVKELDSPEISTKAIATKTSCRIWPKDGSDNLKSEMRSTIWEGGRINRNHREIGERKGSVIKSVMDCYIMANSKNFIYVCWFECYTHFHQQMSCMNERISEKVTGLKRMRDGFSGLHSSCRTTSVPTTEPPT